ncbi:DHHC palmitoyltransferase-domain-containing protein [Coprinopsis sp. MPI-PUGE-AT-0042]|nr:DHHC palmitoyltransferase-domain-containing protein [Coprinopsis sp. MPI-PUGE-AT-0042]
MFCAKRVFRCFKALERFGNRLTGAAGPYFVGLAVILLWSGTICFFDVIAPSLSYPIISIPFCLLVAANLHMHYFYVCTVAPGFIDDPSPQPGHSWAWAKKKTKPRMLTGGVKWSSTRITPATMSRCSRCNKERPERAHHCRICNRCIMKYDHHCPCTQGINQCVGLHNERHFVLFLMYLALATFCFSFLGYPHLIASFTSFKTWEHHVPDVMYGMMYILCVVLCFAVTVMGAWHIYGISSGETSVEGQDNELYRKRAKARDQNFVNSYDLGRKKNLSLFFNTSDGGYPIYTLFVPLRIMPYTDGRSWARRPGYDTHVGIRPGEELTDESDNDGDA